MGDICNIICNLVGVCGVVFLDDTTPLPSKALAPTVFTVAGRVNVVSYVLFVEVTFVDVRTYASPLVPMKPVSPERFSDGDV